MKGYVLTLPHWALWRIVQYPGLMIAMVTPVPESPYLHPQLCPACCNNKQYCPFKAPVQRSDSDLLVYRPEIPERIEDNQFPFLLSPRSKGVFMDLVHQRRAKPCNTLDKQNIIRNHTDFILSGTYYCWVRGEYEVWILSSHVSSGLPRELEERKKHLSPQYWEARSQDKKPKWSLDKLVINNQVHQVKRDWVRDITA